MNIAVFSTHILWPTHYETDLEIIQHHLSKQDAVYHFSCNQELAMCELILENALFENQDYEKTKAYLCARCVQKKARGQQLLIGDVNEIPFFSNELYQKAPDIEDFYLQSHDQFKSLFIDNYDIGISMLSSMISFTRDPYLHLPSHKVVLNKLFKTCYSIYYATLNHISTYNIEIGHVLNGRFSYTKAILKAFEHAGVMCYVNERGTALSRYSLFPNHTIHNIEKITKLIHQKWDQEENLQEKERIGRSFFEDRFKGKMESWKSFTENQIANLLPAEWNPQHHNVVLFASSEDEFASIGPEWNNPIYPSQFEGIKALFSSSLNKMPDNFRLYVRLHPNSRDMNPAYNMELQKYAHHKVCIIPPTSSISSYSLMQHAHKTISFGSSMGIETVFWGKVSILLGKSLYCNLKGTYRPANHEEAMNLIAHPSLQPIQDHEALKYGFFFKSYGTEYQHYMPIDYKSGTFKGVNLDEPVAASAHPSKSNPFITRVISKIRRTWFPL